MTISLVLGFFSFAALYILATGGTFHLSPELLSFIQAHPKYHRLTLSILTLFLIAVILFFHWKKNLREKSFFYPLYSRFIKKIKMGYWLWILFLVLSVIYSLSSAIKHYVFETSFDMAIFTQAIWSVGHGQFLYSSIKGGACLLGDHVSPILLLYSVFYQIWASPYALLLIQAILSASSIFPLYLIGKKVLQDKNLAILFPISLALYLPLRNAVRFDFHPEFVATPLFLWAFYFLIIERLKVTSILLAVILTTKEGACMAVLAFGFYSFFFRKKNAFGIFWMVFSILIFMIDIKVVAPYFAKRDYFYLGGNYLSWFEKGIGALIKHLLQPSTFSYFKKIFLPVGLFAYFSPAFLMAIPALSQNLLAVNQLARSTYFHYTFYLTPFVFISAVDGFGNFLNFAKRKMLHRFTQVRTAAVYWLLSWSVLLTGVSEVHVIHQYWNQNNDHLGYVRDYLDQIPSHFSLRTHEFFAPHVAHRRELHIYENNNPIEGGSEKAMNSELIVVDQSFMKDPDREIQQIKDSGYQIVHEHAGFYVMTKDLGIVNEIHQSN